MSGRLCGLVALCRSPAAWWPALCGGTPIAGHSLEFGRPISPFNDQRIRATEITLLYTASSRPD
jgi:hypothetical protein